MSRSGFFVVIIFSLCNIAVTKYDKEMLIYYILATLLLSRKIQVIMVVRVIVM